MKNNLRTVLSVVLSLVMLLSITLSVVPTAVAEDTVPAAQAGDTLSADFTTLSTFLQQGFKHYYTEQTTQALTGSQPMVTTTAIGMRWATSSDGTKMLMSNYSPTNNWVETWYAHSNLVYTKKTFKNFELDVDYYFSEHAQNAKRLLYIGFGKTEEDKSIFNTSGAGGIAIALRYDGNVALVSNGTIGSFTTTQSMTKNTWANLKLVVEGTTAQVYRNTALIATYTLPGSYNGGYVFFGGNRATSSGFAGLDVVEKAAPTLYTADFTKDFRDTTKWKTYWAKNVLADSSLTAPSFDRCFSGVSATAAFVNRPKQNADNTGTALTNTEIETYSSTFNVAQLTYIAKKYKNFELNAEYEFSTHSIDNARILIGFGREDATKYATHEDGGAVLEFNSAANVTYRDAKGTRAASVSAPSSAAKTTRVAVNLVVNEYKATVSVNEKVLGTFTLSEDYEGYISIGATQANASKFYSLSINELADNAESVISPEKVYSNEFTGAVTSPLNDGWVNYWIKDTAAGSTLVNCPFVRSWAINGASGSLNRTNQGQDNTGTNIADTVSSEYNIAQLTYTAKAYKNFVLETKYTFGGAVNASVMIGFGRKDVTKYANDASGDGGIVIVLNNNAHAYAIGGVCGKSPTNGALAPDSAADGNTVNVRLVVDAWEAKLYINDEHVSSYAIAADDYTGYISIGASKAAGTAFDSVKITATEDNTADDTKKYVATLPDGVSLDDGVIEAGQTVTATVTAPDGKQLKAGSLKYTLDGETYYPITTRVGEDETVSNVFAFTMPGGNVTLAAEFVDASAANHALLGAAYNIENGEAGKDMRFGSRAYRKAGDSELISCGNYLLRADSTLGAALADGVELTEQQLAELINPSEGQFVKRVPTSVLNDRCDDYVDYTVRIVGVADNYGDVAYVCVSYANYRDAEGNVETVYSAPCIRSYNQLINAAQ